MKTGIYQDRCDQVGFIIPKMQGQSNILKSINIINYINGLQDQNYTIISIGEEKPLTKSISFMIKDLERVGLEGMYLKVIKAIEVKHSQHYSKQRKS